MSVSDVTFAALAYKLREKAILQRLVVSQTDGVIAHDSKVCAFIFDSIAEEIETLLKSGCESVEGLGELKKESKIIRGIFGEKSYRTLPLDCEHGRDPLECMICNPSF